MASGDGLIVRVRAGVWGLSAQNLRTLAALARAHGNGLIELTRRANLQLRGVSERALPDLQRALLAQGLADDSPERELRLMPLMLDPLAALDPDGAPLVRVAAQLERALGASESLRLPAKFSIVLEHERRDLGAAQAADMRVNLRVDGRFALSLAGDRDSAQGVGVFEPDALVPAVLRLCDLLADPSFERAARMRELLDRRGLAAVIESVRPLAVPLEPALRRPTPGAPLIGFHAQPSAFLGLALPFGTGTCEAWEAIATLSLRAHPNGGAQLRFAPSRVVVLPGVAPSEEARELALSAKLIVDAADPLLRAIACAGAPACRSALGETRQLARELAGELPTGATLHVSGCDKGCASSAASDYTLVHGSEGVQLGRASDVATTARLPAIPLETARQRLTAPSADVRVRPLMKRQYDYERDGAAIYRQSFAIIRAEAQLARFSPVEERVAVRLIHTSGSVELADEIVFSPGFADAAQAAIRAGAPILCDANMIVSGVTRPRLRANNDVLCFLNDPALPALARDQRTTRSAAALTLWGERLQGAVVAIGNAPTALFRLLELLDETQLRPAAIIGLPVGFVGAAESKEALLADGRVPSMIVRGRRGGSAMTVAAINALASDEE